MKMQSKKISDLNPNDIGRGVSLILPGFQKPVRTVLDMYIVHYKYVTLFVADRAYPTFLNFNFPIDRAIDDTINFCQLDRKKWGLRQDLLQFGYSRHVLRTSKSNQFL